MFLVLSITLVRRKQLIQKFSHINLWQQGTAWFISCEMLYKYFSRFTASFDNHLNWLKNLSGPRNEDCFTQSSKMIVLVFFYCWARLIWQMSAHTFSLFYLKFLLHEVCSNIRANMCFWACAPLCFCCVMSSHWYCGIMAAVSNVRVFVHFWNKVY